ncbi:hypothetical protein AA0229_1220 [Gluconobacter cerinus NRIC 0229]|uniref:Uncharacterized protein n=1 Tax=Gluconobacter cerinus TaxID=38307 RepID=A0AAV5NIG7_9PROT|nr:hypothetical protein [Gluconobacter cerinus]GBR00211.1 hypothetical protein AA0229_1220 [Gluconobacter cerinus NRIC 0229]GLQ63964.1 hypothetical protein GCM10007867_28100 [Gluconobacter cerinus]
MAFGLISILGVVFNCHFWETGNILFEKTGIPAGLIHSSKRWYVRFGIDVWIESQSQGGVKLEKQVFSHHFDPQNKEVLIQFPVGAFGDTLAWMPYANRFAKKHGAHVTCALSGLISPLFEKAYPHIRFLRTRRSLTKGSATHSTGPIV